MKFLYPAILLHLLLIPFKISAQYFDTGTDPAGIKWMQIKTGRYTLIYPASFGKEGISYARSLDNSLDRLSSLYPSMRVKIPVVIHNYTTFSNGYVAWAPRRIEMFPTPEQNTIPLDPVQQLTSHELTHVMQLYSLDHGFLKALSFLGGEQVTGASTLFFPMWFMEGDAVLAESFLSESGRGRAPAFQKQMKAIVTTRKKLYSYDKMILGSFRDFTPDHYQFGYQISAWSSSKYGHDIWNRALGYTSKYPFTLDPVRFSLRESTGLTQAGLYHETIDSLKNIWSHDSERSKPESYVTVNRTEDEVYKNYYSPVMVGKDSIVAIRTSFSAPPSFVLINPVQKTEKRIFIPGPVWPWFISGAKGKIVWVEERPDARWENRTFSDIMMLDIRTGKYKRLSHGARYLAASLSPDGRFIAAAENSVSNMNRIVIIDASDVTINSSTDTPGNAFAQRPQWSDSGDRLTITSLTSAGEGILAWTVKTNSWETLLAPARKDLQSSFLRGDTLFYVSSFSGTDNIWMLLPGGKIIKVTNSRFGAYDANLIGGKICFSEYTPLGYRLCEKKLSDVKSDNGFIMNRSFLINRLDTLKEKSNRPNNNQYIPEPYRKWTHPFRFHSWMPFYADIEQLKTETISVKPGLTLLSQNTLSTVIASLGYEYSEGRHNFHYRYTWKGWYPVFESRIDYGAAPVVYKTGSVIGDPSVLNPAVSFTNSISLPLSFSTGRFSQYLWSSLSATYRNTYVYLKETGSYDYGQTQLRTRIFFSNYDMSSLRDIYPRWAQIIDFSYIAYPLDRTIYGPMTSFRSELFFPGIIRNHSIRLRFESDYQISEKLLLYNIADLPRGYNNIVSPNYRLYSADYVLPICYPDLSIPMLLYLKRIRGGVFYDYAATGTGNIHLSPTGKEIMKDPETFSSFGGEILGDFYLFRLPLMISGGVQASWKGINQRPVFQLIFNINIFGMKIGKCRI